MVSRLKAWVSALIFLVAYFILRTITDPEFYQNPEAVVELAIVLALLAVIAKALGE